MTASMKQTFPNGDFATEYISAYRVTYNRHLLKWSADWAGGTIKPKSRRLTLHWRGHDGIAEGYQSAQIDLDYAFLQCAGEIQIAYSIDRKSFQASRNYFVPARGMREALSTEVDPPAAPSSLRLTGTVTDNAYPRRAIGSIDDHFAGEALGMGCFDGQTRKLGTVAGLVGPGATPDKVKAFLASLSFEVPMYVGPPLTRAGMVGRQSEADRIAKEEEARRLAAEARAKDAAQVDALNATALKAVQDKGREIDAKMAAGRKAQADYEASMVRHRQELAEVERKRQLYEAQMALYRACVAGDRAACERHRAGQ